MISYYSQFQRLTMAEKAYIMSYPHHILTLKESKNKAYSETIKKFGHNGRNDKSDAFRHCFWSSILSRDLGYSHALWFTIAHESSPVNPRDEKSMDVHNNLQGLLIGQSRGSDGQLSMACMSALKNGKLKYLE